MQIRILIVVALVLCAFSGCSKEQRPAGLPALYSCQITITQGEQPLEGALVQLIPESGPSQWTMSGKTGSNGAAKITTHAKFAGAPEGTFKVLVSKTEAAPSKYPTPADNAPTEDWTAWRSAIMSEQCPLIRYVKPEYDNANTTPHSMTIVKGKNKATFDVGEAVEIEMQ
jgi:hypothetical protein